MGIFVNRFIEAAGGALWGPPMLAAFLGTGLYLSAKTGFFQIAHARLWLRSTLVAVVKDKSVRKSGDAKSISQFQALTAALAACIGTGNIVGVATAINAGGPGAVFWMLVSAGLGMMTSCAENVLGIKYRCKNSRGEWIGGAMTYLREGLGMKKAAGAYALFLTVSSLGIGNMTQANSISAALKETVGLKPAVTGFITACLAGFVIVGGIKRIAAVAEKTVPLMSMLFITASLIVILKNLESVPSVLKEVLCGAFTPKSAAGGAAGYGMAKAARYGIARGVFSNEAGLGTAGVIHAASDVREPAVQGMWGIFEVFVDTVVMCTLTALAFLCAGVWQSGSGPNGVELGARAFSSVMGGAGEWVIAVSVALFAFATIIGWSYFGERGCEFLFGLKSVPYFKAAYIAAAFLGCVTKLETVWNLSDIFNGLMAVPNLLAVVLLSGEAVAEIRGFSKKSASATRRCVPLRQRKEKAD